MRDTSRLLTLQQKLPQKSQQGQEILSFEKCIPTATRISEFRGIVDKNWISVLCTNEKNVWRHYAPLALLTFSWCAVALLMFKTSGMETISL